MRFSHTDTPTSVYGDSLKQQVEDRLKFYESGETPRKNIEVMQEAMALAAIETPATTNGGEKKKKKKKRKSEAADETIGSLNGTNGHNETADTTLGLDETNGGGDENGEPKKKKKKKKNKAE